MVQPSYLTAAIASIEEISENAQIRDAFSSFFIGNAGKLYSWSNLDSHTKTKLNKLLELKTVEPASTYRGLFIGLCSIFELFCKNMIENTVTRKINGIEKFEELDSKISASNFYHTGEFFYRQKERYLNGDRSYFEKLSNNLSTCNPTSGSFFINTELLTKNLGNCTPDKLESKFEELGLSSPFCDKLGQNKELQKWVGSSGVRITTNETRKTLKNTIHRRHQVTHPDGSNQSIVIDDIQRSAKFFSILMPALADHAEHC
jgi:hypothetical protein